MAAGVTFAHQKDVGPADPILVVLGPPRRRVERWRGPGFDDAGVSIAPLRSRAVGSLHYGFKASLSDHTFPLSDAARADDRPDTAHARRPDTALPSSVFRMGLRHVDHHQRDVVLLGAWLLLPDVKLVEQVRGQFTGLAASAFPDDGFQPSVAEGFGAGILRLDQAVRVQQQAISGCQLQIVHRIRGVGQHAEQDAVALNRQKLAARRTPVQQRGMPCGGIARVTGLDVDPQVGGGDVLPAEHVREHPVQLVQHRRRILGVRGHRSDGDLDHRGDQRRRHAVSGHIGHEHAEAMPIDDAEVVEVADHRRHGPVGGGEPCPVKPLSGDPGASVQLTLAALTPGTYYWRVRTISPSAVSLSTVSSFVVSSAVPLAIPQLYTKDDVTVYPRPQLTVNRIPGGTRPIGRIKYRFDVALSTTMLPALLTRSIDDDSAIFTIRPSDDLALDTTYYWRVTAVNTLTSGER